MLAPRASNAFVCLRCELHLARRRLPAYARRTSIANFSTTARRYDGADESEAQLQRLNSSLRITREVPDRFRKRKGKVIRETSARLGSLKTLGDDAEILMLREVPSKDKPAKSTEEPAPEQPIAVPDIYASLQQEHEALTPEEIRDRLESLRPPTLSEDEEHFISQSTFVKLKTELMSGFSPSQLGRFYSDAKNIQHETHSEELLASLKTGKRLNTRTEWQPGTTPISKRLPGVDVTVRRKRAPVSKQLLVDRIMRGLWKLVPREEVEAPGEIELVLKPWQLTLLNAGDETVLNKISRERKARIQVYQQHCALRITADKTTAEYAANDVEEALQKVEVKKLQLKPWIPCLEEDKVPKDKKLATLYTQEDFDMVTSLIHTSVQRMDNTNTVGQASGVSALS
jgi:hypothetical protein